MSFTRQSLIILLAIAIVMFFKSLFLSLVVPVLGILVALYLMLSRRKRNETLNFFILVSLVLILVVSTGEMSSPFFFLLYFLIFGIAFVFDPRVVFVFTIGLLALFFPQALTTDLTRNLILLFSFIFLSPLAFLAGVAYRANLAGRKSIEAIKKKAQIIENDVEDVLYDDNEILNAKASAKLNEALQEAEEAEDL